MLAESPLQVVILDPSLIEVCRWVNFISFGE
jgi:hypothetical protein